MFSNSRNLHLRDVYLFKSRRGFGKVDCDQHPQKRVDFLLKTEVYENSHTPSAQLILKKKQKKKKKTSLFITIIGKLENDNNQFS